MTPIIVLVVALSIFLWATYRSSSSSEEEQFRYQAAGVTALLIAGVVGAVLQEGALRFAWVALAAAAAIRLIWVSTKARNRG